MKTVNLLVRVRAPDNMPDERVAELVNMLLDVGHDDAVDTGEESADASDIVKLTIDKPEVRP